MGSRLRDSRGRVRRVRTAIDLRHSARCDSGDGRAREARWCIALALSPRRREGVGPILCFGKDFRIRVGFAGVRIHTDSATLRYRRSLFRADGETESEPAGDASKRGVLGVAASWGADRHRTIHRRGRIVSGRAVRTQAESPVSRIRIVTPPKAAPRRRRPSQ